MNPSKPLHSVSMLDVLERGNMLDALKRVKSNKGAPGIDGMKVEELNSYLKENWLQIRELLLEGAYKPQAVRTVSIPKPSGGERQLGIPTVLDRLIQQAISQTLSKVFDPEFSESSYGFRPKRSALQAVKRAKEFQNRGAIYTVDIDLENFFDVVNHDRLMARLSKKVRCPVLLKTVRRYLQAGLMKGGVARKPTRGTPQGSPLSPLLSNIVLDELDKELEARGHSFCRYADDCQVFVKSEAAGDRVLESLTRFLEGKMRLKVNKTKSCTDASWKRSFLGYAFLGQHPGKVRIRCSLESIKRFKDRIRELTRGHHQKNMKERIKWLNIYIQGWSSYFRLSETRKKFRDLDGWIRSRLRMCFFKIWRRSRTRVRNLSKLGCPEEYWGVYACSGRYWHLATNPGTKFYMNDKFISDEGFVGLDANFTKFANS